MKQFEADGWELVESNILGEGDSALYKAVVKKGGVKISIDVNRNDWGTQGSFELEPKS